MDKRLMFFILVLGISNSGSSQNLIPNAEFEEVIDCPYDWDQIHFAEPWYNPSNGLPIVFNSCSDAQRFQVPFAGISINSYKIPRSGEGYGYIRVYRQMDNGLINYLAVPMTNRLKADTWYYIEFYVSPDHLFALERKRFSDAIGMAFTADYYYQAIEPNKALPLKTAIEHRGRVINDTINWTKISGCYKAEGWESHAIIGNFRSTEETILETNRPDVYGHSVYLYIEDVKVLEFDPLPDTLLLCSEWDQHILESEFLNNPMQWNTGWTGSSMIIDTAGTYIVSTQMDNCVLSDTVVVLNYEDVKEEELSRQIQKCEEEVLLLDMDIPGAYIWNTGEQTKYIEVNQGGIYTVTITNSCEDVFLQITVEERDCACPVFLPTAITPNADGINDRFEINDGCDYPIIYHSLSIFDRWGNKIFYTNQVIDDNWDGTFLGSPVAEGSYIWLLEFEIQLDHTVERKKLSGEVTLLK